MSGSLVPYNVTSMHSFGPSSLAYYLEADKLHREESGLIDYSIPGTRLVQSNGNIQVIPKSSAYIFGEKVIRPIIDGSYNATKYIWTDLTRVASKIDSFFNFFPGANAEKLSSDDEVENIEDAFIVGKTIKNKNDLDELRKQGGVKVSAVPSGKKIGIIKNSVVIGLQMGSAYQGKYKDEDIEADSEEDSTAYDYHESLKDKTEGFSKKIKQEEKNEDRKKFESENSQTTIEDYGKVTLTSQDLKDFFRGKNLEELTKPKDISDPKRNFHGVSTTSISMAINLSTDGKSIDEMEEKILRLASSYPLYEITINKNPAIVWLASYGKLATLKTLIRENNIDFNICNHLGTTPLIAAIKKSRYDIAQELLANGADLDLTDYNEKSGIDWAIETDSHEMILLLLKNDAKISNELLNKLRLKYVI
ncbi:MAG: hypothetical protein KR126chlam5_00248 [Candidatus Anoxychlamydiales bacterium]|nr:hypothetical protein [Candidatus Anoxychlamydiales bacterium]